MMARKTGRGFGLFSLVLACVLVLAGGVFWWQASCVLEWLADAPAAATFTDYGFAYASDDGAQPWFDASVGTLHVVLALPGLQSGGVSAV